MANLEIKEGYMVAFNTSSDDSTDFVEYFKTLDKAKEFAKSVLEGDADAVCANVGDNDDYEMDYDPDDIDKTTLKIYKVQLVGKPKITLAFH